jgi:release factor glutamine methyltransferase
VETTFCGLPFATSPGRVFSPRPTTEALVERALALAGDRALRVADAGTGTGAIGVSLAVRAPALEVWATDRSPAACELAAANAARHGVSDRVHVVEGDLLDPLPGRFDLIVANLPYLPEALHDPAYDDEPHDAVYAPGDGLGFYRRLLSAGRDGKLVIPGGAVVLQFRARVLVANCWELEDLRARLDELQPLAA